jgi:uncharacterized Zn-finger protein
MVLSSSSSPPPPPPQPSPSYSTLLLLLLFHLFNISTELDRITLMMEMELVLEILEFINHWMRLSAREHFIELVLQA